MDSFARLVVIQDGGLRAKTPLFDSQNRVARDSHHTPAELASFVFGGSGMAMSDHAVSVKIHNLPALPALPGSILVSRLFSLDPSFQTRSQPPHRGKLWAPEPILDADDVPENENLAVRFAIAVVVPISDSFVSLRDTITENWLQISNSLVTLEAIITAKLRAIHLASNLRIRKPKSQHFQAMQSVQPVQSYQPVQPPHQFMLPRQSANDVSIPLPTGCNASNSMKRLNFSKYSLQSEIDIHHAFVTFSKMIVSLTKTQRLFHNLKYSNQTLINWATNLSAWMALKDAAPVAHTHTQTNFLVFMLSVLLPSKEKFFLDPLSSHSTDVIRLVIGTGNPVVSEKLIFILSGFLGYEKYAALYDQLNDILELSSRANSNGSGEIVDFVGQGMENRPSSGDFTKENPLSSSYTQSGLHALSQPIPFSRAQSPSYFGMKFSGVSPSPNSRGWSPSLSQSINHVDSDKVSIKSGLAITSDPIPSPRFNDGVPHSVGIPIRGLNSVNAEPTLGTHDAPSFPSMQRSTSYASLQNISASYGTTTPTSSLGASNSWRNVGSWIDRWKWSTTNSPRQNSKNSALGSSLGRTVVSNGSSGKLASDLVSGSPSPNFGPEGDWEDTTLDGGYFAPRKSVSCSAATLANSPAKSDHATDSFARSKCSASNSFGFGVNYKCKCPPVQVERSVGNLKTITYEKITKSIQNFVDEIMDADISADDFVVEDSSQGISVANLSYPKNQMLVSQMNTISSTTIIRLPLLVGFVPEYHSEYTLMSCPVSNPSVTNGVSGPTVGSSMLESTIVKSLRHDVSGAKRKSRLWLVNVGMRWVKLFEANSSIKSEFAKPVRPSLNMRSHSSSGGLDMSRSYSERKSNLTTHLQRPELLHIEEENEIPVSQKVIFSSNCYRPDDNLTSEKDLDLVNEILMKITLCIDAFITETDHPKEGVSAVELEELCCNTIRSHIHDILAAF